MIKLGEQPPPQLPGSQREHKRACVDPPSTLERVKAAIRDLHVYDSDVIEEHYTGAVLPCLAYLEKNTVDEEGFRSIFMEWHGKVVPKFYISALSAAILWKQAMYATSLVKSTEEAIEQLERVSADLAFGRAKKYLRNIMNPEHFELARECLHRLVDMYPSHDYRSLFHPQYFVWCNVLPSYGNENKHGFFKEIDYRFPQQDPLGTLRSMYIVNCSYESIREQLSSTVAFIRYPPMYIEAHCSEDSVGYNFFTRNEMKKRHTYTFFVEMCHVKGTYVLRQSRFWLKWIADERGCMRFSGLDFDPSRRINKTERCERWQKIDLGAYNMWGGFEAENYDDTTEEPEVEMDATAAKFFGHVRVVWANNDESKFNKIADELAMIAQRRWQAPKHVTLIVGGSGAGKDAPIEILERRVFGSRCSLTTCSPKRTLYRSLSAVMSTNVLVGLRDTSLLYKHTDGLGSHARADTIRLYDNKVGCVEVKNWANLFFTTTKKPPSTIERGVYNHWLHVLHTNDCYVDDHEYFKDFFTTLDNSRGGYCIYQWLKRRDLSHIPLHHMELC